MLAGGKDLFADLEVQMVGSAVVDHFDFFVSEESFHAPVGLGNIELVRLGTRQFVIRFAQRNHLNETGAPRGFDVCRSDETGPNNACLDRFHGSPHGGDFGPTLFLL